MALAHFRMLIHEFLNKDPYIVPEEFPLIVLDSKSAMCMAKNGKDTKHIITLVTATHGMTFVCHFQTSMSANKYLYLILVRAINPNRLVINS